MKKKVLSIIIITFITTISVQSLQPLIAYASDNKNSTIEINNYSDPNTENILEQNFSDEELKILETERNNQDKIEAKNGFTERTTDIIVSKDNNISTSDIQARSNVYIGDSIYYVDVVDTYTSKEEILNKSTKGMSYWLDVTWNLAIGSTTKYLWKATTILGLNPSNFLSTYKSGDKLSSTRTKVVKRRCYKKYNSILKYDVWYLETRSETIKNYVDLYTFDKSNNSIRKSNTDTKTFYSKNYSNTTWIKNYVNNACATNLQVHYTDNIE